MTTPEDTSTPQQETAIQALDRIGEALRAQGVTLEELLESGREIRGELIRERYGLLTDADD